MEITIKTKSFNLHELTSTSCYINFCFGGTENNDEISFKIKDGQLLSFIDCITLLSFRSTMFYQNNAGDFGANNPIIAGRMESFARLIQMVKEILAAIGAHKDFKVEDLNS